MHRTASKPQLRRRSSPPPTPPPDRRRSSGHSAPRTPPTGPVPAALRRLQTPRSSRSTPRSRAGSAAGAGTPTRLATPTVDPRSPSPRPEGMTKAQAAARKAAAEEKAAQAAARVAAGRAPAPRPLGSAAGKVRGGGAAVPLVGSPPASPMSPVVVSSDDDDDDVDAAVVKPHGGVVPLVAEEAPLVSDTEDDRDGGADSSTARDLSPLPDPVMTPEQLRRHRAAATQAALALPTEVVVAVRVRPEVDSLLPVSGNAASGGAGAGTSVRPLRSAAKPPLGSRRCLHVYNQDHALECVNVAAPGDVRSSRPSLSSPGPNAAAAADPGEDGGSGSHGNLRFHFDTVFDEKTTQQSIFDDIGRKLVVDSVMEGYHGTILCYGQSGSGKTHTMIGPDGGSIALKGGVQVPANAGEEAIRVPANTILQGKAVDDMDAESFLEGRMRHEYFMGDGVGLMPRMLHCLYQALEEKARCAREESTERAAEPAHPHGKANTNSSRPKRERYFTYGVSLSAVELYNEELRDLLTAPEGREGDSRASPVRPSTGSTRRGSGRKSPNTSTTGRRSFGAGRSLPPERKLRIHDLSAKVEGLSVRVENLESWPASNFAAAISLISAALRERRMGATRLNINSSRAHTLFFVKVRQTEEEVEPAAAGSGGQDGRQETIVHREDRFSVLTFVDLAGSERVSHTGATGQRLEEAKSINLSLALLGNVIRKLTLVAEHQNGNLPVHIPFRDSKLTRLLRDSFGGSCVTYLLCNVSPDRRDALETVSTLRFAKLAKRIKNRPVANAKTTTELSAADAQALRVAMAESACLRQENDQLREQLRNAHEYATWLEQQIRVFATRTTATELAGPYETANGTAREVPRTVASAKASDDDEDLFDAYAHVSPSRAGGGYGGDQVGLALAEGVYPPYATNPGTREEVSRALTTECLELARKLHLERSRAASAHADAQLESMRCALLMDEVAVRDERIQELERRLAAAPAGPASTSEDGASTSARSSVSTAERADRSGLPENRPLICRREARAESGDTAAARPTPASHVLTGHFGDFLHAYGFAIRPARGEVDVEFHNNGDAGARAGAAALEPTGAGSRDGSPAPSVPRGRDGAVVPAMEERALACNYGRRRSKLEQLMDSIRLAVAIVRNDEEREYGAAVADADSITSEELDDEDEDTGTATAVASAAPEPSAVCS